MKKEKDFKYHLKKDVRDDLEYLVKKISVMLYYDHDSGFYSIPVWSILPALFKVYSHLIWCRTYESWFKKVYE